MKKLFMGFLISILTISVAVKADDFFDGLIVSDEMQKQINEQLSKEDAIESGKEQANKLLETKPTILKVQKKKVRVEQAKAEDIAPVVREPAPFGLKWLARVDEIRYLHVRLESVEVKDSPYTYMATNLPKSVSGFREVLLSFGDNDSLWRIAAYGKFIKDDSAATKGLEEYHSYYQMLEKKYGNAQQFYMPATVDVEETIANADGTQSVVTRQESMPVGANGFLPKLMSGEATLYATFDNGKIGITLALLADGRGQTYIVVDYKNLMATKLEQDEIYDAL